MSNDKLDVNILFDHFQTFPKESFKKSALYMAVEDGNIEIAKLLLSNDTIDVNLSMSKTESSGNHIIKSPLYAAIEKRRNQMVKLLLSNDKIDVNLFFILI